MKYNLVIIFTLLSLVCSAQKLISNEAKIEKAKTELENDIDAFQQCILNNDLDSCIETLISKADNPYKKYLVGGMLFEIDAEKSFELHQEAYLAEPNELNFNLEYALELHRKGQYMEAADLYKKYAKEAPDDFRANVWLADCFINVGDIQQSIKYWAKANHSRNHTAIDQSIHIIYGRSDQVRLRNTYRTEIKNGHFEHINQLIFMDMNWQLDWWNTNVQKYFLEKDLQLLDQRMKPTDAQYTILKTYTKIKSLSQSYTSEDSIRTLMTKKKMIINNQPLPTSGLITSDLLRICFKYNFFTEYDFYNSRGEELLKLAQQSKDIELLNSYAYLQSKVNKKVESAIDRQGWVDFKDERFAMSYFTGKVNILTIDDKELNQAISDFPSSSGIYWFKVNAAKNKNLTLTPFLVELIKKEFKTLGSDPSHYSYRLHSYFQFLAEEQSKQ